MQKIRDLVFVITGASSGIGRGTALEIARRGGKVVLAAREKRALREVAAECQKRGARALAVPTDVTDERMTQRLAEEAFNTFGRIDVWINNAGTTLFGRFEETPADSYRRVIETNLFGYINGARAVLPYFRRQGRGVLINHSSFLGKVGMPYVSAYAASNFAIRGWAESLRLELMDTPDIQVCTILAASIDTPLFQHAGNYTNRAARPTRPVEPPEKVIDAILKCALNPKPEVRVGSISRPSLLTRLFAPHRAERMIPKQVEKGSFEPGPPTRREGNLFEPMPEIHSVEGHWRDGEKRGGKMALTGLAIAAAGAAALLFRRDTEEEERRASERIQAAREELEKRARTAPAVSGGRRETARAKRAGSSATRKAGSRATSESPARSRQPAATARRAAVGATGKASRSRSRSATRSRRG